MRRQRPILIDVDGVALDWVWGFREYLQGEGVFLNGERPNTFSMEEWTGLERPQILKHIIAFNASGSFGELNPVAGAVSALKELAEDHTIIAITSCSTDPLTIARRRRNLEKHFGGAVARLHCLDLGESKTAELKKHPNSWWIEDRWEGALEGFASGHEAIILHWPYNDQPVHPDICRCTDWGMIKQTILWGEED